MRTFRIGGIHPPENKLTADRPIERLPLPEELSIMMSQCIGAPSKPIVKAGEEVIAGQMIAEAGGFVGAPVHSPVNGKVKKIEAVRTPQGLWQQAVIITPDVDNPLSDNNFTLSDDIIENLTPAEIIGKVGDAGIVGLGGATFPTRVKLSVPQGKKVDTVLLNGAECEPYLTCDDALMKVHPHEILKGMKLIMKATGASNGIVGIEENKKEAFNIISKAAQSYDDISVVLLKKKYPQGSEKQLIYALTKRVVPAGCLPIETSCVVDNVATAFAIYQAIYKNIPLYERIVTVTGKQLTKPGNYIISNGTPISWILDHCGGIPDDTGKIIAGGPMMGRAISCLDATATKGLSGVVVMSEKDSLRKETQPCIRCAACINVCPMGLEPYLFMQQALNSLWTDMADHGVANCLECGCCSYSCPSSRPLVDMIRLGKFELRKKK